jgi:hypothetical protein
MLMRISNHDTHAGQCRDFLRRPLGIAAGHQDPALGILTVDAANGRPDVLVGRSCDGAGIENDDVCIVRLVGPNKSPVGQFSFDGRSVCLRRAAAEVLDVKAGHGVIIATTFAAPWCSEQRRREFRDDVGFCRI